MVIKVTSTAAPVYFVALIDRPKQTNNMPMHSLSISVVVDVGIGHGRGVGGNTEKMASSFKKGPPAATKPFSLALDRHFFLARPLFHGNTCALHR